jgi:4-azaleucine resistance transporter AzlC
MRTFNFKTTPTTSMNKINLTGIRQIFIPALPVILGYLPVGFAYGVLAANAGLTLAQGIAMSAFVFAGSSQLIAVGMIGEGINPLSIVLTTLIVNLRHLLMSASLSPYMKKWKRREVAGFAFEMTDETFAVHSMRFKNEETSPRSAILINAVCQGAWLLGSLLGALAGGAISDVKPFALDYALPAMFIALLLMQIQTRRQVVVAVTGGALSLGLWAAGVTQWNVILAVLAAATLGAVMETKVKKTDANPLPAEDKK